MDRSEIDELVGRLLDNPHDEEALAQAHQAGEADPKSYAVLLEKVGSESRDPAYAAHWLGEAANVWSTTLGDVHRAARLLMMAIDKDPTAQVAADRLAQLYRDKGDTKALVALLDRRAKALAPLAASNTDMRTEVAGLHEELGRLWSEPPLSQPRKAVENYKKALEFDPTSAYAIYQARELYKSLQQYQDAIPLYAAELELEQDSGRRVGLLRDEAATRKLAGDLQGATQALAAARELDAQDPALQQEYASSVLDRIQSGEAVPSQERAYASDLLVALAETYQGEHGYAYAAAALDIEPGHDRAVELYAHYARELAQEGDLSTRYNAYLAANPAGTMSQQVRQAIAAAGYAEPETKTAAREDDAPGRGVLELAGSSPLVDPAPYSDDAKATKERPVPAEEPRKQPSHAPAVSREPIAATSEPPPRRGGAMSPEKLQGVLDAAQMLAGKGKKPEAYAKYKEVLEFDAAHPEALSWVEDYLRSKRDYAQLRDVLLSAIRATASVPDQQEARKERLREVAGLCEGNLRDVDGAIAAWRQLLALDRADESARTALMRLLEKSQRWDDLANLLEQEATIEPDLDTKILLEKKLAKLQEDKRKDVIGAGEAWARIARLSTDDDQAVLTASRLFEKGERLDLAAQAIAEASPHIDDPVPRGALMLRLGELREQLGQTVDAGDAYAEAAEALRNGKHWEEADRLYSTAEAWEKAANAAYQRGQLTGDVKQQAAHMARASEYLVKAGRPDDALARMEEAADLDPLNDDYAEELVTRYNADQQVQRLVAFLTKRGDRLADRAKRINVRREAANLCATRMADKELARELWLKLLEDGDDKEALERLIDDAVEREDHTEAATLLRRLGANTVDKAEKARVALREAEMLADGVGDVDTAISCYELILSDLDPTCRPALQAIADLQESRGMLSDAADALERELKLVADVQERGQIAGRLARLYEKLDDPRNAIRALDLVRKADLEDFDALTRLCELCELTEQWGRVAELLVERIEVEADEQEIVELTKKLAGVLADKLDRGDEALGALTDLADSGEPSVRQAYIELGDKLGWKGIVASKLKEWWFDARHAPERTEALRGAFERFADVGRDADAVTVAIELIRTKTAERGLAEHLEELAVKTSDHDALQVAHELLAKDVTGPERAHELVRQAEVRARAGMPRLEAIQHGEAGLTSVQPSEAEPLLERLAVLAAKPADVIDLYERQVTRSKAPPDRIRALARAAQVSSARGQPDRARGFLELALSASPEEETLTVLEAAAREGDKFAGGDRLRRALCQAMAAGGQGARDGGRTRANLLRRAATISHRDLSDVDQAFTWLADALVAHVDQLTLDTVEALGLEIGDPRRGESALTHALGEVFDGPLVRQLLARRAKIRRDQLVEPVNAAIDLKKLHDLSPNDQAVMDELAGLYIELGDYKALVQLYEDQILRGKDMNARAELARRVARVWEEQLQDAREAADGWRRVLRMKAGDVEATAGLDRAKQGTLKTPEGDAAFVYAPPKLVSDQPVPVPSHGTPTSSKPAPAVAAKPAPKPSARPIPEPVREPPPPPPSVAPREDTQTRTVEAAPKAPAPLRVESAPPPPPRRPTPPPLPPSASTELAAAVLPADDPNAKGTSLESEIEASLDRLEFDAPTASTLPREVSPAAMSIDLAHAREDESGDTADITQNIVPGSTPSTERDSDPSFVTAMGQDGVFAPSSQPVDTTQDFVAGAHKTDIPEELGSGEIIDLDDEPTRAPLVELLEETLARPAGEDDDEEIVVADDLADAVDEDNKRNTVTTEIDMEDTTRARGSS